MALLEKVVEHRHQVKVDWLRSSTFRKCWSLSGLPSHPRREAKEAISLGETGDNDAIYIKPQFLNKDIRFLLRLFIDAFLMH